MSWRWRSQPVWPIQDQWDRLTRRRLWSSPKPSPTSAEPTTRPQVDTPQCRLVQTPSWLNIRARVRRKIIIVTFFTWKLPVVLVLVCYMKKSRDDECEGWVVDSQWRENRFCVWIENKLWSADGGFGDQSWSAGLGSLIITVIGLLRCFNTYLGCRFDFKWIKCFCKWIEN